MKPYPRIRKTVKWGGAAAAVVCAMVWIAAEFWSFSWGGPPGRAISVSNGELLWGKAYALEDSNDWGIEAFPVPLWLPVVVVLIPTAIPWWLDARDRRRIRLNRCPKCNYDRTGLPAGAVCPECGKARVTP